MARCCRVFTFLAALVFMGSVAWAQSSGSFNYSSAKTTACVLNNNNTGIITGGLQCPGPTSSCTTNSDCTAPNSVCDNPTGGASEGICVLHSSGGACTTVADCAAGQVCLGGGGSCGLNSDCGNALGSCAGATACTGSGQGTCSSGLTCEGGGVACTTSSTCAISGATQGTCSGQTACSKNSDCTGIGTGICSGGFCGLSGTCSGFCSTTGTCQGECGITCSAAECGPGPGCIGDVEIGIKTSSGNGNVFVVRPSAVIGLLTDVTVSSKQVSSVTGSTSSSALAGVDFEVTLDLQPAKSSATVTPSGPVTYDARFIQISTNLFNALSSTCTSVLGGCFFTFNESTVSAHSFDFVVGPLASGNYIVEAQWTSSLGDFGIASSMTCVGPVNLTVAQNKIFTPSTKISTVTF